ncbi:hypothetical protein C8T65DRAFT_527688, partial [Cerioporus squamosus]
NKELDALNAREGRAFIKKTPRALMDHLGKTETKILARLATNNFKSKESGATDFWTCHCHAVSLGTKSQAGGELNGKKKTVHILIMYPGATGADINHRKAFCSDSAQQSARSPAGIFSNGTTFHPLSW